VNELYDIFMDDGNVEKHEVPRFQTGWYSFDNAVGGAEGRIGLALRSLIMIYGHQHTGKSTLAWSLMAKVCKHMLSNMALLNFESMDRHFFVNVVKNQGFAPPLAVREIVYEDKEEGCEQDLKTLARALAGDDFFCCLLDSVGAVATISEVKGDYGERHVGGRAFVMNQFTREVSNVFARDIDGLMIATNHIQPGIGFAYHNIPGGTGLKFFSHYHWLLKYDERDSDANYIIQGQVKKNKYGADQKKFNVYILFGKGAHTGMTAVQDCIDLKLAGETRKVISLNGEKIGRKKSLIEQAHLGNDEVFQPFLDALYEYDQEKGSGAWTKL
jgi:recombination protein RecA